jgi:hypothetical protein
MALSYFSPQGISQAAANNIGTFAGMLGSASSPYPRTQIISGNYLYCGGSFKTYIDKNGKVTVCNGVAKIDLTTGLHDTTFSTGTGFNDLLHDIKLYDSGASILCAGAFTSYNGTTRQYICKINATTGAVDTTFNTASGTNAYVHMISSTDNSGNDTSAFWIAGGFTSYKGTGRVRVARINGSTGALDTTFLPGTGPNADLYGITPYFFDGTTYWLFILGGLSSYAGTTRQSIAKINAITGALDATFMGTSGFSAGSYTYHFYYTSSGANVADLWVTGNYTTYKGTSRNRICKVNGITGALDTTFNPGTGFSDSTEKLASDGTSLWVGGYFTTYNGTSRNIVAKLNLTTAALDTTFAGSSTAGGGGTGLALDSTNNVIYMGNLGGTSYSGKYYNNLIKISSINAQTVDQAQQYGFVGAVQAGAISGNYIYLAGTFTGYVSPTNKYTNAGNLIKLNRYNGEVDTTFDTTTALNAGSIVRELLLDGSGNLYIAGQISSYKGTTRTNLVKVNATTAALDTTFDTATGFNSYSLGISLDGSGGLFVTGNFTTYKGTTRQYIAKLNATTAALDTTFDSASGFNSTADKPLYTGGALYVIGNFTTYKGTTRQYVAKLNATTAALDTTFDSASGFNAGVYNVYVDGSDLVCSGIFSTYKGTARQGIAKINTTTAALNTTFNSATGIIGAGRSVAISGGNYYACGEFTTYKGTSRIGVVKINGTTAALDTTFLPGTGLSNTEGTSRPWWVGVDASGAVVYVCGEITAYQTQSRRGIAILDSTSAIDGGIF